MKKIIITFLFGALIFGACAPEETPGEQGQGKPDGPSAASATVVSIDSNRPGNTDAIVLGAWREGQTVCIDGHVSKPLAKIDGTKASFEFEEEFSRPFNVIMPAEAYVDQTHVVIDDTDPQVPFAAYVGKGQATWLKPLCGGLRIPLKGGWADSPTIYKLSRVEIRGKKNEQMSGKFTLDYRSLTLTSAEETEASKVIRSAVSVSLSATQEKEIELMLPAGEYDGGLLLKFIATDGSHYEYSTQTALNVSAGNYVDIPLVWYRPGEQQQLINGSVKDTAGNPIPDVVVSDGLHSAKTDGEGRYVLPMDQEQYTPKFVYVSTPREYSAPVVGGQAQFWKSWETCKTLQSVDFILEPNDSPDRYTLLLTADPQTRLIGHRSDKIAYRSIDATSDMFRDMREYTSTIVGRKCYGIVLGDIVHERMEYFPHWLEECATLNFPMYSVIGNHDHDSDVDGEDVQHAPFERYLGPRNYSVNLGMFHVVVLDNFLLDPNAATTRNDAYGISDMDMEWLRNDLMYVPETTHLIVCAHSPMFMHSSGNDRSSNNKNGSEYAALIKKYEKVYHFAGHTHTSFNYIYPEESDFRNIEVHVVARATGLLWLNDYVGSGGTPRGYLVCEIDGENIRWRYRITPYLSGECQTSPMPPHPYRLWTYNNGVAYVGSTLFNDVSSAYQITPYNGGVYPDGKVYANVYMWDEKWGDVYLKVNGGGTYKMERVPRNDPYAYDYAEYAMMKHYEDYNENYSGTTTNNVRTLFRIKPNEGKGNGVITVTDRFGETFTADVSW